MQLMVKQADTVFHGDNRPAAVRFADDLREARILADIVANDIEKIIQTYQIDETTAEAIVFLAVDLHRRIRSIEGRIEETYTH
ncbi:hypothetical protein HWX16_23070 [Ochrobactrum intermedium]|uniref:hypothetical protein n=1 Tax=Brucella intermedia TaxID=94625 RepID=UPI00159C3DAC|nr:hypothetical protein [Brucella intermedia]NVM43170.1 hypothetical protein [Brucella intermedia]